MCLQAHYRSELEFSWENLAAAFTRLKRMVMSVTQLKERASGEPFSQMPKPATELLERFDAAVSDDLGLPRAVPLLEEMLSLKPLSPDVRLAVAQQMDGVFGLKLLETGRADLRLRPASATLTEAEIEGLLAERKDARAAKDFATSDRIRDSLLEQGVEVMDGDPLGWDWKLEIGHE